MPPISRKPKEDTQKLATRRDTSSRLLKGSTGLQIPPRSRGRAGRSRRLRLRRLLLLIVFILAAALTAEVVYAIYTSYRFALQEVRVEGTTAEAAPLVLAESPQPGPNLFALSNRKISRRIKSLSFVQAVSLHKKPPGTLLVRITERDPAAFLKQKGEVFFIDAFRILYLRPGPIPAGTIEVRGLAVTPEEVGQPLSGTLGQSVCIALEAFARRPKLKISLLRVDSHGALVAHLASGTQLRLGTSEDLELKLDQAEAALAGLKLSAPAEYFDLSSPDASVWKPAQPKSSNTLSNTGTN